MPFDVTEFRASLRFVQGYRYLDRCGEALIKLESSLHEGWIPTEPAPKGGGMKNDTLGLVLAFNSDSMNVHQTEFIAFDHFRDQTCKAYDVLWQMFGVERINAPAISFVLQKGFEDIDTASAYLSGLALCSVDAGLIKLLEGRSSALDFVLVTTSEVSWNEQPASSRRRIEAKVIRQERQAPFDTRLMKRTRLLSKKQQEAMEALMKLRRQHPEIAPVAAQVELEYSLKQSFPQRGSICPDSYPEHGSGPNAFAQA